MFVDLLEIFEVKLNKIVRLPKNATNPSLEKILLRDVVYIYVFIRICRDN
jgi:hypothetical protein